MCIMLVQVERHRREMRKWDKLGRLVAYNQSKHTEIQRLRECRALGENTIQKRCRVTLPVLSVVGIHHDRE